MVIKVIFLVPPFRILYAFHNEKGSFTFVIAKPII